MLIIGRACKELEFETRKTYYYRRRKWRTRRINRGSIVCYLVPGIQVFFCYDEIFDKKFLILDCVLTFLGSFIEYLSRAYVGKLTFELENHKRSWKNQLGKCSTSC